VFDDRSALGVAVGVVTGEMRPRNPVDSGATNFGPSDGMGTRFNSGVRRGMTSFHFKEIEVALQPCGLGV